MSSGASSSYGLDLQLGSQYVKPLSVDYGRLMTTSHWLLLPPQYPLPPPHFQTQGLIRYTHTFHSLLRHRHMQWPFHHHRLLRIRKAADYLARPSLPLMALGITFITLGTNIHDRQYVLLD
ncbi:hypothetical protein AHAS_Ahas07G0140500 [Arachis hypogaea]